MDERVVEFLGDDLRLALSVRGYERPTAEDASDLNWLDSRISLETRDIRVTSALALTADELGALAQQMDALLGDAGGEVTWEAEEQGLSLHLELSRGGSARISGVMRLTPGVVTSIAFKASTESSSLRRALSGLQEIVDRFPQRTWLSEDGDSRTGL